MGFESPQSFKEIHEIQPALKHAVEGLLTGFESKIRNIEEKQLEYEGKMEDRYVGMDMNTLLDLHFIVGDFRFELNRLKKDFKLDEPQLHMVDELIDAINVVIHSDEEMQLIRDSENKGDHGEIRVNEELANSLANKMYVLTDKMKKLRALFTTKNEEDDVAQESTKFSKN